MSWLLIAGDTKTDRENYFAEVVVVNELVGERIMHRKELFQLFLFFSSVNLQLHLAYRVDQRTYESDSRDVRNVAPVVSLLLN